MAIYRNSEDELKKRLRTDLNLPDTPLGRVVPDMIVLCTNNATIGYAEVAEQYPGLFCPYDHCLHRSTDCDQKQKEIDEALRIREESRI